jgi:magnesium chelatase family protein
VRPPSRPGTVPVVAYDLPIAIGVLRASEQIPEEPLADALFLGELSLDGTLRHTPGILPMVVTARKRGLRRAYVATVDANEAALVDGVEVVPVSTLARLVDVLRRDAAPEPMPDRAPAPTKPREPDLVDFADVKGQEHVKRALEVAAAGSHNVLMAGPPGAGKTLLARALPGILPPLSPDEALEVSKIYSVAGLLPADRPLVTRRPFRSPHHTTSHVGLVGGGRLVKPGEVTLAQASVQLGY